MKDRLIWLLTFVLVMATFSCDSPLVGLGGKVGINAPVINITEIAVKGAEPRAIANPEYVRGIITLSGTCSADITVSSVSVTIDTITVAATLGDSKKTWYADIDTKTLADGEKTAAVSVVDDTGKVTETRTLLYVDNSAPIVMISSPASTTEGYNGFVTIAGTAYDPYSVKKVIVKVYAQDGDKLGTLLSENDAVGTADWTYNLDASSLSGKYFIVINAQDRAGNTNSNFYFYNTIRDLNNGKYITLDQMFQIVSGNSIETATITKKQIEENILNKQILNIDPDSDKPSFDTSSPLAGDVVGINPRANGMVMDDDGVKKIEVRLEKNDIVLLDWLTKTDALGLGSKTVRWSHQFAATEGGSYVLKVRATDIYDVVSEASPIVFTIDTGVPTVTINPLPVLSDPGSFYYSDKDTLNLTGTASVSGATITTVNIYIEGVLKGVATGTNNWNYALDLSGLSSNKKSITVEAVDNNLPNNRKGTSSVLIMLDSDEPAASIISPTAFKTVYGEVSIRGITSDNNSIKSLEVKLGKSNSYEKIDGYVFNWTKNFSASDYANDIHSTETGSSTGVWRMPLTLRITDIAGNVHETTPDDYYLLIDLDRDRPTVDIQSPIDVTTIGGSVWVSGIAYDEAPGLDRVEMKIVAVAGAPTETPTLSSTILGTVKPDGSKFVDNAGWFSLSGTTTWKVELNTNGQMYDIGHDTLGAYPELAAGVHNGHYIIYVRSFDSNGRFSNESYIRLRLDSIIPRVDTVLINSVPYLAGALVSRTAVLTCNIEDNEEIKKVGVSWDSGTTYTDIPLSDSKFSNKVETDGKVSRALFTLNINTLTGSDIPSLIKNSKTGVLYMNIKVEDGDYITVQSVRLNIDNKYPMGGYSGQGFPVNYKDAELQTMQDTAYRSLLPITQTIIYDDAALNHKTSLEGYAYDYGSVGEISTVSMYLTRDITDLNKDYYGVGSAGTYVYHLANGVPKLLSKTKTFGVWSGSTLTETINILYPSDINIDTGIDSDSAYRFDIIKGEHSYALNQKEIVSGTVDTWRAEFDSSIVKDGPVTINYVITDKVGNTTYYNQKAFIKNKTPVITSVKVGTDLNASGSVTESEKETFYNVNSITSALTMNIRDRMYIEVQKAAGTGNDPVVYSITEDTDKNGKIDSGETTTLSNTAGVVNEAITGDGAKWYICKITDAVGLSTSSVLKLNYANSDATEPSLEIAAVGQKYTAPLSASFDYEQRANTPVATYDDNFIAANAGHVEYATDSTHNGTDADVSGAIVLRGKMYEDQYIGKVTVSFNVPMDVDGNGSGAEIPADTEIQLALYNTSDGLKLSRSSVLDAASNALGFALSGVNDPLISFNYGHTTNFEIRWNTAFISGGASDNVIVTLKVYNKDLGKFVAKSLTVDVVPYITDITRKTPFVNRLNDTTMNPGKKGYYPVYQGSSGIEIKGFNLPYSSATSILGNGGIAIGATALISTDVTEAKSDRTGITIKIPSSLTSGEVLVTTNTVASINNTNTNSLSYATEGLFNDDRIIYVDDIAPSISVAPFGKKYSVQASDDATNGVKALTEVSHYTENIPYTGTDKTIKSNWLGHVEYKEDSLYGGTGTDADISGKVTFKGKAFDNQRVNRITVQINSFNTGTEFDIYTLASGALTGADWTAVVDGADYKIDSSRIDKGHVLNWNFSFDSSKIATVAKDDVSVAFKIYDSNGLASLETFTVDVVPYITLITDLNGLSNDVLRGSTGKYSISAHATNTLTVKGYNLGSLGYEPQVRSSKEATAWGSASDHTSVPVFTSSNEIKISKNWARSGYITLVVNGVPSGNNLNKNEVSYNTEISSDPRTSKWTDDRYLWVWANTQINLSGVTGSTQITPANVGNLTFYNPNMVMNSDQPEFSFNDENFGQTIYTTGDTSATRRTGYRLTRPAGMAATSISGIWQRFISATYDSQYGTGNDNSGFLEVTGFADQTADNMVNSLAPSSNGSGSGGNANWSTIQGVDYYGEDDQNLCGTYRKANRYIFPKLIAETSTNNTVAANLYMTYFDSSLYQESLNFISFQKTGSSAALDNIQNATGGNRRSPHVVTIPGTKNASSKYYDMIKVGNGIAVAYYDPVSKSLKLASSTNPFQDRSDSMENITTVGGEMIALSLTNTTVGNYAGKYFTIYSGTTAYDVWFDTTGSATKPAAATSSNEIKVDFSPATITARLANIDAALSPAVSVTGSNSAYLFTTLTIAAIKNVAAFSNTPIQYSMQDNANLKLSSACATQVIRVNAVGDSTDISIGNLATGTAVGTVSVISQGTAAPDWGTITVDSGAISGDTSDVGMFVSMAADGGKLYVSYYDFDNANLKFARITWNGTGTPTIDSRIVIDSYLSAGTWTKTFIMENAGLTGQSTKQPVIAYYADSYNGTKKPIRMAFPKFDANGASLLDGASASDEKYSGNWEVLTIPALSVPKGGSDTFNRVQGGVYSLGTLPVLGWLGDKLEYSKLLSND